MPKYKKEKKYIDMTLKFAAMIGSRPYNMKRADQELVSWVKDSYHEEPPLDISYCNFQPLLNANLGGVSSVARASASVSLSTGGDDDTSVLALEPPMGRVEVNFARVSRPRAIAEQPSSRVSFISSVAATYVREHGYAFKDAAAAAEDCWKIFPKSQASSLELPDVVPEAGPEDFDNELLVVNELHPLR